MAQKVPLLTMIESTLPSLTRQELKMLTGILQAFTHTGPWPDENSLPYFTLFHVRECLRKARNTEHGSKPSMRARIEEIARKASIAL